MYKQYNINQVVLPIDLEFSLDKNDIAYAIHNLIESIPEKFFADFEHHMGPSSYHPKMMLKIILCGYTQSAFSGRKIEDLTKDSLRMMWLAQNYRPSYRTINRFRINPFVNKLLRECFIQFRHHLVEEKLIDSEAIFIDGTKIEANANKYTFVWKKAVKTNEKKLDIQSAEFYDELVKNKIIPEINRESDTELTIEELSVVKNELEKIEEKYTTKIENEMDVAVRKELRSKRKIPKKLKKSFQNFIERKTNYLKHMNILVERNSYSKTDHDATFMRMKDDHMRNGQLKAGYNLQIATNHQFIIGFDVFPNPTDTRTLIPFLTTLKESFLVSPKYIVADAGYGSESNYRYIEDELPNQVGLISYGTMLKEQTKKWQSDEKKVMNWTYFPEEDYYINPKGVRFNFYAYRQRKDKEGFIRDFKEYHAEKFNEHHELILGALTSNGSLRKITVNPSWEYFKASAQEKISNEETGKIYRQRKIDVEPAFGYLKAHLKFTRFSVRGKDKVTNEIGFALMAVNLRKYRLNVLNKYNTLLKNTKNRSSKIILKIFELLFFTFQDLCPKLFFVYFFSSIIVNHRCNIFYKLYTRQ